MAQDLEASREVVHFEPAIKIVAGHLAPVGSAISIDVVNGEEAVITLSTTNTRRVISSVSAKNYLSEQSALFLIVGVILFRI